MTTSSTTPRVALVTGANKGVGHAIAQQLAELGITVYLGARNEECGAHAEGELRAAGHDVRHVRLDVTDPDTAALAAKRIEQETGKLDTLVNNAGISPVWRSPSQTPVDDLRDAFETNVFGAVTNAMLPLLRRSGAARIVNISSVLGSLTAAAENHDPTGVFPDGGFPVICPRTWHCRESIDRGPSGDHTWCAIMNDLRPSASNARGSEQAYHV